MAAMMGAGERSIAACVVIAMLAACRAAAVAPATTPAVVATTPEPTPPVPESVPASALRWPDDAFALTLPPLAAAPWLLPVFEPGRDHPLDALALVAHGDDVALVRSASLVLGTDRTRGVAGPIELPSQTLWLGIGRNDVILAATTDGTLHRADSLDAAVRDGLHRIGAVPGATLWDAAGAWLVAAQGGTIAVSSDGGTQLERTEPLPGGTIEQLAVRSDGVIAAAVRHKGELVVMLSGRGGRSWSRASWQPLTIARDGAWIVGSDTRNGVLAADGVRWLERNRTDDDALYEAIAAWRHDFDIHAIGYAPRTVAPPRADAPPPPSSGKRLVGRKRHVPGDGAGGGGMGMGMLGTAEPCRGPACLHGTIGDAPPPSAIDVHAFGDLRCAESRDPCPAEAWRPGHAAIFDHERLELQLVRLPQACRELRITPMRGLVLAACRHHGGATLYAVDGSGRVEPEMTVRGDDVPLWAVEYASMTDDGTIVVPESPACERWAKVWIRRPLAIGSADAWREVTRPRARTWRVLPAGRALGVIESETDPLRAELWLDRPDAPQARLAGDVRLELELHDLEVVDGRVVFQGEADHALVADGSLVAIDDVPRHDRIIDGVFMTRARPYLRCR